MSKIEQPFIAKIIEYILFSKWIRRFYAGLLLLKQLSCLGIIFKFNRNNRNKIVVAFNASDSYQFEHIKDFYSSLKGEVNIVPIVIGPNKNANQNDQKEMDAFVRKYNLTENKNLFSYVWLLLLRVNIFIEPAITSYADCCSYRTIKILYVHGLSALGFSKNYEHIKKVSKYNYLMLTGPLQKRAIAIAQKKYNAVVPEVIEIGFSSGDRLIEQQKNFDRNKIFKKYRLENEFNVLFAPTWGSFSATKDWIDIIVRKCMELNVNLLIRLHPLMIKGRSEWETAGVNWRDRLVQIKKSYANCVICDDHDIDLDLLGSDLLITDASSVGLEYMILEKPVIFLPVPKYFEIYGEEQPVYWVREGLEVKNVNEFSDLLSKYVARSAEIKIFSPENIVSNINNANKAFLKFIVDTL